MSTTLELLLEKLDSSREQLLISIVDLSDQELSQSGAYGGWSVADVLANLTAWEAELVTGLMRLEQGRRPDKLLKALRKPEAFDEACYSDYQGRDLDRIFSDWHKVRVQLEDRLPDFNERQLSNRGNYRWLGNKSLKDIVVKTTVEREQKVLPALRAFAASQEILGETTPFPEISLGSIDINSGANG